MNWNLDKRQKHYWKFNKHNIPVVLRQNRYYCFISIDIYIPRLSMGLAHLFLVKKYIRLFVDGGRRLCQYNEDDFLFKFKLLTRFFRITSLQVY